MNTLQVNERSSKKEALDSLSDTSMPWQMTTAVTALVESAKKPEVGLQMKMSVPLA